MTAPSTPTTLRFERSGSNITVSVWDSSTSNWLTQAGWSFSWTSVDVWPSLSILLENQTTATATWKNFQFNVGSSLVHTAAGTYTTPVYDAGRNVAWDMLSWQETLPSGSDLKLQLAVSDDPQGPWNYLGPDGTSGTYFTTSSGESVGSSVISRYCRVRAYLEGDGTVTPTLEQLELSYSGNITSAYQAFSYDAAGNLTEKASVNASGTVTETRTYNDLNELVDNEIDDGTTPVTWTYTHDDNGNLVSKTDGTDTFDYTWDDQNRLVEVEFNSVSVVTYEYDSASRMIQRDCVTAAPCEGGTTTTSRRCYEVYTWDGWDLIREEKTGTVTETTNYLVPFGEVLAFERGGEWYYLHGDALSSTQLVTDESGAVVGRYVFGAWGDELISNESVPGILENKFVGGLGCRRDSATGLIYMRHRWYDVGIQRFISRDPVGLAGGTNLYLYPESPTNHTDSSGLQDDPWCNQARGRAETWARQEREAGRSPLDFNQDNIQLWGPAEFIIRMHPTVQSIETGDQLYTKIKNGELEESDIWAIIGDYVKNKLGGKVAERILSRLRMFKGASRGRGRFKTTEDASEQFESIQKRQAKVQRQKLPYDDETAEGMDHLLIESIKKSKKREKNAFKRMKGCDYE